MSNPVCDICPHACTPAEGCYGLCRARKNKHGKIVDANYGRVTAISLDPIEKKPLRHFHPGSNILSAGSFGCNLRCPFCQNSDISMADESCSTRELSPETLVTLAEDAIPDGNIGIAYTYNEPLVGYEYVFDCARSAQSRGLKNVLVTNGYINETPLKRLLQYIDAMNIDLKGWSDEFYRHLGGDLETVKKSIELSAAACHVELTTLIIPGLNDATEQMHSQCEWIASISSEIPLHITRYFPRYKISVPPTPLSTLQQLALIARKYLRHVHIGNC